MGLSNELISQFAKITNDKKTSRIDEVTLYGEVIEYEDSICVKFDGSEEITPVTTVVEKDEDGNVINYKYGAASVKTGDRVSVNLKNHSATITGNLTDPPPGRAEVIVDEDSILARVDKVNVRIDSLGVAVNGLTTFQNGLSDGTTTINGGCIKTGKIDAQYLNLTGAITFGDLASDAVGKIDDAQNAANAAQGTANAAQDTANTASNLANKVNGVVKDWGYTYGGTTYIDGSKIMTGTVTASILQGGEIQLLDVEELTAATFELSGASSYEGRKLVIRSGAIEFAARYGNVYIGGSDNSSYVQLGDETVTCKGNFLPNSHVGWDLGRTNKMWSTVYAKTCTASGSDRAIKKDISSDLVIYNRFFDLLTPCSYKLIDGTSGRTHLGMISQEVEEALNTCGISSVDFAGFIKSPKIDDENNVVEGEYDYALRYGEFIPLLIWQVQKLKARVAELEATDGRNS